MNEQQAKRVFEAGTKIGAEMRSMMDALEKLHGTELTVLAHHYAGFTRSIATILSKGGDVVRNDLAIMGIQVDMFFQFLCQQVNVEFIKMLDVSNGIRETMSLQQADLNEAANGIPTGDKNGTKTTDG